MVHIHDGLGPRTGRGSGQGTVSNRRPVLRTPQKDTYQHHLSAVTTSLRPSASITRRTHLSSSLKTPIFGMANFNCLFLETSCPKSLGAKGVLQRTASFVPCCCLVRQNTANCESHACTCAIVSLLPCGCGKQIGPAILLYCMLLHCLTTTMPVCAFVFGSRQLDQKTRSVGRYIQ